jgi:hypothetical protein
MTSKPPCLNLEVTGNNGDHQPISAFSNGIDFNLFGAVKLAAPLCIE